MQQIAQESVCVSGYQPSHGELATHNNQTPCQLQLVCISFRSTGPSLEFRRWKFLYESCILGQQLGYKLTAQKKEQSCLPIAPIEAKAEAAAHFLTVMRRYLELLCTDLRSHTITSVQSNDRVSLLLKDSFVDSFPSKDQPFIKCTK